MWLKSTAKQKIFQRRKKKKPKKKKQTQTWLSENADSAELKYFKERCALSTQPTKNYRKALLLPLKKSKYFVWWQHKTSETIKCVWGLGGEGRVLLRERLFILLAILKPTCSFHAKTKTLFKTQGTHKNPAFQPTVLVTDGHNSLFPQSSWSFVV